MKKILFLSWCFVILVSAISAQNTITGKKTSNDNKLRIGLKAGYNISYLNGTKSGFSAGNNNGFMIAGFLGSAAKSLVGYRSEIVFSRQGYTYENAGTNTVMNDYIYLPQLTTINITKFLQLQIGAQIGYLLNSKKTAGDKRSDTSLLDFMNRIDYGFAGGLEIHPFKGLIIGARYNLGLGKMYKEYDPSASSGPFPIPFDPATVNLKNGGIQFFAGYQF